MVGTNTLLEVSNLTKNFGGITAVDNVSFHVNAGEIVALIGTNGAGKTTCFNLITGFDRPNGGEVTFNGSQLVKYPPFKISSLGLVRTFQHTNIFGSLSVLNNLLIAQHMELKGAIRKVFFNKKTESHGKKNALALLELAGMSDEKDKLASSLPYGSQKILGILMALACKPKLLALDEPAAGLNATETNQIFNLLKKVHSQGITILVVEHDMKFIMDISSRIIVMAEGKKIAEGTPEKIKNNELVQEIYFGNYKRVDN